ncbi:hypothetical protein GA0074695_0165 [Micromonospora viridifaciens]|uniref:Uncharacterized protein n=1 Tax=Micromonospora viridifaciens TaxID=1881 RepID=A0A1C4U4V5_MICVI|nr:hypothetical protein [Micromonospora viridifaciens]SCE66763.1 hypothetical protein GA0074695_0165 [Micromonospora viridifaciens]
MRLYTHLYAAVSSRLAELRRDTERGDSPVPTAVIIFGLVAVAMAVTAAALLKANNWMNAIPDNTKP